MNDVAMQQLWGAIRTLLGVGAGFLIGKGFVDEATATTAIGAIMTLIPLAWSAWDKHRSEKATKEREAVALNVGIAVADRTPGPTPPIKPEDTSKVLEAYKPVVIPSAIPSPGDPVVPAAQPVVPSTKLPFGVAKP